MEELLEEFACNKYNGTRSSCAAQRVCGDTCPSVCRAPAEGTVKAKRSAMVDGITKSTALMFECFRPSDKSILAEEPKKERPAATPAKDNGSSRPPKSKRAGKKLE